THGLLSGGACVVLQSGAHARRTVPDGPPGHTSLVHGRARAARWGAANTTEHQRTVAGRSRMGTRATGRHALMSIRPEYAERILAGTKRIEFRKRPLASDITDVIVYATTPVRA